MRASRFAVVSSTSRSSSAWSWISLLRAAAETRTIDGREFAPEARCYMMVEEGFMDDIIVWTTLKDDTDESEDRGGISDNLEIFMRSVIPSTMAVSRIPSCPRISPNAESPDGGTRGRSRSGR